MKKQNTSYKEMLRDRVPLFVDLALKWCKAKEIWINHVYNNFINIYVEKDQRYHATRIVLGISSKYRNFDFNKTIAWDNLTDEEKESWESVETWVSWFSIYGQTIIDKYKEILPSYKTEADAIFYIVNEVIVTKDKVAAYKLVKFIINSL